jgi:hypothetical protein
MLGLPSLFRDFCVAFSRPWDFGDTPTFFRNYMSWVHTF